MFTLLLFDLSAVGYRIVVVLNLARLTVQPAFHDEHGVDRGVQSVVASVFRTNIANPTFFIIEFCQFATYFVQEPATVFDPWKLDEALADKTVKLSDCRTPINGPGPESAVLRRLVGRFGIHEPVNGCAIAQI